MFQYVSSCFMCRSYTSRSKYVTNLVVSVYFWKKIYGCMAGISFTKIQPSMELDCTALRRNMQATTLKWSTQVLLSSKGATQLRHGHLLLPLLVIAGVFDAIVPGSFFSRGSQVSKFGADARSTCASLNIMQNYVCPRLPNISKNFATMTPLL